MARHGQNLMAIVRASSIEHRATAPAKSSEPSREQQKALRAKAPALDPVVLPPELQLWLEFSGRTLLAMRLPSVKPKEPSAAWVPYIRDYYDAYGRSALEIRVPLPTAAQIRLMDMIHELPKLLDDPIPRRLVQARSLVRPLTGRYVIQWIDLGKELKMDRRKCAHLHGLALAEICLRLPPPQAYAIRDFYLREGNSP